MSLSSLNSIGQSVFELESGNENVNEQTDGQMDVGHINLIGGLVTRNPPNKKSHYNTITADDENCTIKVLLSSLAWY